MEKNILHVFKNQKLHGEDEQRATVHALCQHKSSRASDGITRQQVYNKQCFLSVLAHSLPQDIAEGKNIKMVKKVN